MSRGEPRIALVHDEFTRRGGAEVVCEELLRLWPQARVYALYTGRPQLVVDGQSHTIHVSPLQSWPAWFRRHPKRLLEWSGTAEAIDILTCSAVCSPITKP